MSSRTLGRYCTLKWLKGSSKIINLIPKPNISDTLVNNFDAQGAFYKLQLIPSIKIDHSFGNSVKVSGYYSWQDQCGSLE